MARKLTKEEWIERARSVHGDKYDYSLVEYKNKETKILIICSEHGVFEQIPNNHLRGKGCAECAPNFKMTQKAFIKKANLVHNNLYDYSVTNFTKTADKVDIICHEHGVFSQEANSHLRGSGCPDCADISRSIKVANHLTRADDIRKTNMAKYGVGNVMLVPEFKQNLLDTNIKLYGVDNYTKTQEYKDKYKQTVMDKYGVSHYSKSDEFSEKYKSTMIAKYGVDNYAKSDEYQERLPEIMKLNYETRRKNGSFNTSKPETDMGLMLKTIFGEDDVLEQYDEERYPFMCDFYIKSRDMFIELNATWTHGKHWCGSGPNDNDVCNVWSKKGTDYYDKAVKTFCESDVLKRNTAKNNNLNYLVFWAVDLLDFKIWLEMGMPDGKDYIREYSWLKNRNLSIEKRTFKNLTPYAIIQMVRYYQQDVFYEKEIELWESNSIHKDTPLQMKLYMNRYRYKDKSPYDLTDKQILGSFAISGVHRGYSSFDSSLMLEVINKYKPTHIFDPFAGWGERMILSSSLGVTYEGVDINDKLKDGYDYIVKDMSLDNVSFTIGDSLDYVPSINTDMLLTCPPYHDVEVYTDRGLENKTYDEFLKSWSQLVDKNKNVLMFCFQINQQYKEAMSDIVESKGFELVDSFEYQSNKASHLQRKGSKNNKIEYEEMLVFKNKKDNQN